MYFLHDNDLFLIKLKTFGKKWSIVSIYKTTIKLIREQLFYFNVFFNFEYHINKFYIKINEMRFLLDCDLT